MCGYKNDELATRWVQLGCFSPILRLHSSNNPFNSKEPWTFNAAACKAQIAILQFRHRLIPYLYTMNYISARDGVPLVQPMYYDYPDLGGYPGFAYTVPNQFLFGSSLMVAPITSPTDPLLQMSKVEAWLPPKSRYVDIFTSTVYDGDRRVKLHRSLNGYPVLAREGAIIPLDAFNVPENTCGNPSAIELLVVVGADGTFELLEDDGTGRGVEDAKTVTTKIEYDQATGTLTIGSPIGDGSVSGREWRVRFLAYSSKPASITIGGRSTSEGVTISDLDTIVTAKLSDKEALIISLGDNPQLKPTDVKKSLYDVVDRAQVDYNAKSDLWNGIFAGGPKGVVISRVLTANVPQELKEAVLEYLLADERSTW